MNEKRHCDAPADGGPCGAPAEFVAFGWDAARCGPCKDRYVRHAGASSAVACWLPVRAVQEYSLSSLLPREAGD